MKVTEASHTDHVTKAHVAWIVERFAGREGFFIETVEVPEELPTLECGLHGPRVDDAPVPAVDCRMVERSGRVTRGVTWPSRVCDRPTRQTRTMTIIAGPDDGEPMVLYTAFGGPRAPREPGDPDIRDEAEKAKSDTFWSKHALSG